MTTELRTQFENVDWTSQNLSEEKRHERLQRKVDFIEEFIDENIYAINENAKKLNVKSYFAMSLTPVCIAMLISPTAEAMILAGAVSTIASYAVCEFTSLTYNHKLGEPVRDEILTKYQ